MHLGIAVALILAVASDSSTPPDECARKVPAQVRELLGRQFPGHRIVRVSDYSPEDIRSERAYHGGSPCPGVERGDFDGDGREDVALLVVGSPSVKFVVARQPKGRWTFEQLWDFKAARPACCYVNILPPGDYENFYGTKPEDRDYVPEPNERLAYRSRRTGAITGKIESSGISFFLEPRGWVYVRTSD